MPNNNDFLMHYGILGMHWGIRKKYEPKTINKQFSYTPPNNKVMELSNKIRKIENDFYANEELYDHHLKICAKDLAKKWLENDPKHEYFKNYKDAYDQAYNGYRYGDFDQGDSGAFEHYLKENPKVREKYYALHKAHTTEIRKLNPNWRL